MKYRKLILFLIFALGAAAVCKAGGLTVKFHDTITVRQEAQAASGRRESEESGKIAVVNLDEGVRGDEGQINYAQRLSRFPTVDFEYTSLEAARKGVETGRYGAYIIIPAVFSQNVVSINTAPQVSQLEYAVNRSCSKELQYELLYNVQSYIDLLNSRLSYMYVDNILKEFHEAQDYADSVMENDMKDKAAIEKIKAQDLAALVEVPELQIEENTLKAADISEYTKRNAMLSASVQEEYARMIREVQDKAAALYAKGTALSERLGSLSAQAPPPDFTVDENGEGIMEKADSCLSAELERQSERLLDKDAAAQYLGKLLEKNQQRREEWQQISGQPGQIDAELLLAWFEEEEQQITSFLEEIKKAKALDTESIIDLVRVEYSEPLKARAEEAGQMIRQRQDEELAAVASYNEQLAGFQPQINAQFISQSIDEMSNNSTYMQDTLLKSSRAYMEYAQRAADSAREYADGLYKNMDEIQRKSDQAVADGLKEAQRIKKETSQKNQKILGSFASMLPFTRNGSAENTLVYQFIVNPLTAEDQSEEQRKNKIYFFIRRRMYEY